MPGERLDRKETVDKVERHIVTPDVAGSRPVLVLMSGLPGTGKSHLGRRLQQELPAALVQTDFVRKQLFPRPTYAPEESAIVYDVCHEVVAHLLAAGHMVVMDATNLFERQREIFYRIAERASARLIIVRTVAPRATILERLDRRARGAVAGDISDADIAVYDKMRGSEEQIRRKHIVVDTSGDVEPAIGSIVRLARGD